MQETEQVTYPQHRWFALVTVCAVYMVAIVVLLSPTTLIAHISHSIGADSGETTLITMSEVDFFTAGGALLGGALLDRFGVGRVYLGCLTLLLLCTLAVPVAGGGVPGMLVIRALTGAAIGPIMASGPSVTMRFPERERATVIGVQGSMVSVGAAISMAFVPMVYTATGSWQWAMASVAVFCVVGLALAVVFAFHPGMAAAPTAHSGVPDLPLPGLGIAALRGALRMPATWALIACSLAFSWLTRAFNDMTPNYLSASAPTGIGLGPLRGGSLMSMVQFAFIAGALASSLLLAKVFRGRVRALTTVLFTVAALAYYAIRLPAVYGNSHALEGVLLLTGFAVSVTNPVLLAYIASSYPAEIVGKLAGFVASLGILGGLAGVAVESLTLHATGTYQTAIALFAVVALVGAGAAPLLRPAPRAAVGRPTPALVDQAR
ncbi:MFS transporter [Streptomyces sp. NPDC002928]|uniref:MFS transporter n=1 Tax=Streptomyces sp. NPDC002928 TaxID=3154440 RepID=UPI0033AA092D